MGSGLPELENIKVPQSYFTEPFDNVELHLFGESSRDIFSAGSFLRAQVTTPTGAVKRELAFVLGKARVVPMKVMTVPKLKIQAALLAARRKRENTQALTVTEYSCGQTARPFSNGITPKKSNQSLLQTVFAKFWCIPANGTTLQLRIIQLTLAQME